MKKIYLVPWLLLTGCVHQQPKQTHLMKCFDMPCKGLSSMECQQVQDDCMEVELNGRIVDETSGR